MPGMLCWLVLSGFASGGLVDLLLMIHFTTGSVVSQAVLAVRIVGLPFRVFGELDKWSGCRKCL